MVVSGFFCTVQAAPLNLSQEPLFLTQSQPPLVMLNMARDHKLYYEAYNDYSDLDGDGTLDLIYKPGQIDYYGYFDSYKCYDYDESEGLFKPVTATNNPVFVNTDGSAMTELEKAAERLLRKTCTGHWTGDWLNYVTTSRMDALRKVLYGGARSTDSDTQTVLERVFVPQDSHTWGKEYKSIARDGYDIQKFTPLALPSSGNYHLFANVTLLASGDTTGEDTVSAKNSPPLLRVLTNTKYRVWEWLSIERPVAGTQCATGNNSRAACTAGSAGGTWSIVSNGNVLSGANFYSYSHNKPAPANRAEMDALFAATTANRNEGEPITSIDCKDNNCDRYTATDNNYAVVITGNIVITTPGNYNFAVDSDDASDFTMGAGVAYNTTTRALTIPTVLDPVSGDSIPDPAVLTVAWYGGHGFANNQTHSGSKYLAAGSYPFVYRMEENSGGDGYRLHYQEAVAASTMTDKIVRVEVCNSTIGLETNCRPYGSAPVVYKPTGLLQKYGESNSMYFGMMSGSYRNNTRGGVLRKNISSIADEYDEATGILNSSVGIIKTINRLRVTDFNYSNQSYSCGWITTRPMKNNECNMWGNPLGEIVMESIRYFSGKASPTASFVSGVSDASTSDSKLGLPLATWVDPYATSGGGYPYCSKPYFMAISDVYPSFDSDSIPGSKFCTDESSTGYPCAGTTFGSGDLADFSMEPLGQKIWDLEFGAAASKSVFIGQNGGSYDNSPTPKTASSFGNIRGLAPSEPTRQGSFSSAIAAFYGHTKAITTAGSQKTSAYAIALAAPLPTIEVPMGGSDKISIVPFAKSVGGSSISATGAFQPTDQIVDFYIDDIANTTTGDADATVNSGRPYYKFRINYEDVEQGADHDMDAISTYEIKKLDDSLISVSISSDYAAGGIIQHMGYVISGAKEVGAVLDASGNVISSCDITSGASNSIYLDVRDSDTGAASDPDFALDTRYDASVVSPSACTATVTNPASPLGLSRTRYFRLDTSATAAALLKDPLWYMAKYGGFSDTQNTNGIPDDSSGTLASEWDADENGVPDNYFLVVNPLKLEQQMGAALAKISKDSGTSAALASNSTSLTTDLLVFQALFSSEEWSGGFKALKRCNDEDSDPSNKCSGDANKLVPKWEAQFVMAEGGDGEINPATRFVLTYDPNGSDGSKGIPFVWSSMTELGLLQNELNKAWNPTGGTADDKGEDRVDYFRGAAVAGFRTRPCLPNTDCTTNFLGDIVNSAAQYVAAPAFGYGIPSYKDFYSAWKSRSAMVYVGSNDGMLHGFEAETGIERLAYIPSSLYRGAKLSKLTAADYGKASNPHAFFVNGTPTIGDVCEGTCATADDWRTLLVGGLGGGGQGVYALDVTDPSSFEDSNAENIVLWEFTDMTALPEEFADENASDLGYTYSRPSVIRICTARDSSVDGEPKPCTDSQWVVMFGSGYNNDEPDGYVSSDSSKSHVFILDALTGTLLKKITTPDGIASSGMATVAPGDADADGIPDYAYAGDVDGNMWKIDLDTLSTASVAYRLYQAKSGTTVQPITTTPEIVGHPLGGAVIVFGTGKYIEVVDNTNSTQQTVYGIWDKPGAVSGVTTAADRSNLQQQSFYSVTSTFDGATYTTSTANAVDWSDKLGWYLDLHVSGTNPSERVGYDPQMIGNVLNVPTIVPSSDICSSGGDSWDYLVSPLTGARPDYSAFSGVPKINVGDGVMAFVSGRKSNVGIAPTGIVITSSKGEGVVYKGGAKKDDGDDGKGDGENVENFNLQIPFGLGRRLSWRELESD